MPIYEYRCEYCGETREYRFNMNEAPPSIKDEYDQCPAQVELPHHRFVRILSLFNGNFGDTRRFHA